MRCPKVDPPDSRGNVDAKSVCDVVVVLVGLLRVKPPGPSYSEISGKLVNEVDVEPSAMESEPETLVPPLLLTTPLVSESLELELLALELLELESGPVPAT